MATNQPESVNDRLSRLENRFTNTEQAVAAQSNTIDVLVANIIQLTENVNNLALQAAQDRQQAAIDRPPRVQKPNIGYLGIFARP